MVKGDPFNETEMLVRIQDSLFDAPGSKPLPVCSATSANTPWAGSVWVR